MPSVEWSPEPAISVRSEAFPIDQSGQPVTLLRHHGQNTGKEHIKGELFLMLGPSQIAPPWQYAGGSPIRNLALEGSPNDTAVRANGRLFAHSLSPVQARGAACFGVHGESELTQGVVSGTPPTAAKAHDYDGLAAAYLRYEVSLAACRQHEPPHCLRPAP